MWKVCTGRPDVFPRGRFPSATRHTLIAEPWKGNTETFLSSDAESISKGDMRLRRGHDVINNQSTVFWIIIVCMLRWSLPCKWVYQAFQTDQLETHHTSKVPVSASACNKLIQSEENWVGGGIKCALLFPSLLEGNCNILQCDAMICNVYPSPPNFPWAKEKSSFGRPILDQKLSWQFLQQQRQLISVVFSHDFSNLSDYLGGIIESEKSYLYSFKQF